jgi:cellulose synthase (UDP-forming)
LVRANGAAVGSIAIKPGTTRDQADVPLQTVNLRPFSNSFSMQWSIERQHGTHCDAALPANASGTNFSGTIEGTSYLDLHGLSHWAAMPNLELFSNAGFPFTRFADLGQTVVVLPDQPSPQEIELYLTLLAHFGAQTGYPALRVSVGNAATLHAGADDDFLIIGTGTEDAGVAQLADQMPVRVDGRQLVARQADSWIARLRGAWQSFRERFGEAPEHRDLRMLPGDPPDALIEGFESPYAARRSIVVLDLKDAAAYGSFLNSFLDSIHSSAVSDDVAVFDGRSFQSFHAGESDYSLGERPWLTWLKVSLIHGPWFMVLGLVIFSLLTAARMQTRFRQLSKVRLHLEEKTV